MMEMTILVENTGKHGFSGEWGLSILAEYHGLKYLLDTGGSDLFLTNAKKLGVDISGVDYGILSHAHYDHANGMGIFFRENKKAPFYVSSAAAENCYSRKKFFPEYIGIKKGTLNKYKDRIRRVEGNGQMEGGVWLLGHTSKKLAECGKRENMCIRQNHRFYWDDFSHEQSVVFELPEGLVIFNGCCHGGVDQVIREVKHFFPDKKIYAIVGGFHLFRWSEEQVEMLCRRLRKLDVAHIYTGHCTGEAAGEILKRELGDRVEILTTGKRFRL